MYMTYNNGDTFRIPSSKELKLKRDCPGYYTTTDGQWVVSQVEDSTDWIVRSDWDQYSYSDPIATFGEAKINLGALLGIKVKVN